VSIVFFIYINIMVVNGVHQLFGDPYSSEAEEINSYRLEQLEGE